MKHRIKLIGLDMDGTLLNSQLEITPYTKTILEKLIQKGIEVVAITGRPRCAVPKAYFGIPGIRFLITSNGAQVQNFQTGEFIYQSEMPSDTVMKLIETLLNEDAMLEVFKDGQAYINKAFMPNLERYITDKPFRDDFILNRVTVDDFRNVVRSYTGFEKFNALFTNPEEQAVWHERLAEIFPDVKIVATTPGRWLEITNSTADKGTALHKLAEYLGISQEETLAMGDSGNDITMLQAAGISVAMINSPEHLKKMTDYISDEDNEHDGAVKMIEKLVL